MNPLWDLVTEQMTQQGKLGVFPGAGFPCQNPVGYWIQMLGELHALQGTWHTVYKLLSVQQRERFGESMPIKTQLQAERPVLWPVTQEEGSTRTSHLGSAYFTNLNLTSEAGNRAKLNVDQRLAKHKVYSCVGPELWITTEEKLPNPFINHADKDSHASQSSSLSDMSRCYTCRATAKPI